MNSKTFASLRPLLIPLAALAIIGIIMVYSASYIYSKEALGDSAHFFKKQLFFVAIGTALAFFIQAKSFEQLQKRVQLFNIATTVLLLCTFIPGIGIILKGSRRWLDLGPLAPQPGEFVKYAIAFFSIHYFCRFELLEKKQRILGLLQILFPLCLFILQPDFGSFIICLAIISFVAFLSNFPRKYFYFGLISIITGIISLAFMAPYRVQRLMSYLDPWQDPQSSGFQIIQSFLAFANGHFLGKGIGNSNEKLFYLPEAHNDFIFSVVGEELGLIGVLAIVSLFVAFLFFGLKIALNLKHKMAAVTVSTIVFTISIQALLNMGVVLGLLPTKGMNLPFISYGGSSLIANFLAIGVLVSAAKTSELKEAHLPRQTPFPSKTNFYRFNSPPRPKNER